MVAQLPYWITYPDWLPAAVWAGQTLWSVCWLAGSWRRVDFPEWSSWSVQWLLHSSTLHREIHFYTLTPHIEFNHELNYRLTISITFSFFTSLSLLSPSWLSICVVGMTVAVGVGMGMVAGVTIGRMLARGVALLAVEGLGLLLGDGVLGVGRMLAVGGSETLELEEK